MNKRKIERQIERLEHEILAEEISQAVSQIRSDWQVISKRFRSVLFDMTLSEVLDICLQEDIRAMEVINLTMTSKRRSYRWCAMTNSYVEHAPRY